MKFYQKIMVFSWVICSLVVITELFAQEEPTPMYLDDKGGEGEVDTIYTGLAIIYGEKVDPPYYVEFKNDTAWVNCIPVYPMIKTYYEEPLILHESEFRNEQRELSKSIVEEYVENHNNLGEEQAIGIIKEKYESNALISQIEFEKRDNTVSCIRIEYTDGNMSNMGLSEWRSQDGKILSEPVPMMENRSEGAKRYAQLIAKSLKKGAFHIIGFGYEMVGQPGDDQMALYGYLEDIAAGTITREQAIKERQNALFRYDAFWKEFELKKESWK